MRYDTLTLSGLAAIIDYCDYQLARTTSRDRRDRLTRKRAQLLEALKARGEMRAAVVPVEFVDD